jgi:glycosyltransferase involved in cell wall biosynthesis
MKYLTVLEDLDYRGSQRVAQNYSLGMKKLGHDVRVLTTNALGSRVEQLLVDGIACSCLATQDDSLDRVCEWLPDVVHVHRPGIHDRKSDLIVELKRKIDPIILETSIFSRVDYKIPPNSIDIHLHLTKWCLWKWRQWSQDLPDRSLATVLPYSVMSTAFYRSSPAEILVGKREIGIPEGDFVFGRIGANQTVKWHPIIIDAFKNIALSNENVSLLLVAPPSSIEELVKQLPDRLQQKVFVLPKVASDEQLRLLYSIMNVMVHAAQIGESFGMVLAESLLCETPIITLSSPQKDNSQTELIRHKQTGLVANNQDAFTRSMQQAYDNPDRLRAYGKNGREDIISKYENDRVCQQIELLCDILVSHRHQPKSQISQALQSQGFMMEASSLLATLDEFEGAVPVLDRLMASIVHQPRFYRFYSENILLLKHRLTNPQMFERSKS